MPVPYYIASQPKLVIRSEARSIWHALGCEIGEAADRPIADAGNAGYKLCGCADPVDGRGALVDVEVLNVYAGVADVSASLVEPAVAGDDQIGLERGF